MKTLLTAAALLALAGPAMAGGLPDKGSMQCDLAQGASDPFTLTYDAAAGKATMLSSNGTATMPVGKDGDGAVVMIYEDRQTVGMISLFAILQLRFSDDGSTATRFRKGSNIDDPPSEFTKWAPGKWTCKVPG